MQASNSTSDTRASIDALSGTDALEVMLASHISALKAARPALAEIAQAAGLVARAFEAGGCIHYAAAGSSGLMALADACELPGTFGLPLAQIRIHMAGGVPADGHMPGDTEDSQADAEAAAAKVSGGDVCLVVSASGTTPFALAFARVASARGAAVVGIANTPLSALLEMSDVAISLDTSAEVVAGSTRLGAGTAQKVALNMISTQAGVLLGHVHDGMMVNLNPENIKLRQRAAGIVAAITGVPGHAAQEALEQTGYNTKLATLVAAGARVSDAQSLLNQHRGRLGACLRDLGGQNGVTK